MDIILMKDGIVENVICADSLSKAREFFPGYTCVQRTSANPAGPGDIAISGGKFERPPVDLEAEREAKLRAAFAEVAEDKFNDFVMEDPKAAAIIDEYDAKADAAEVKR